MFGFNGLGSPKEDKSEDADVKEEKKISFGGLAQLITAGMGAPFLGDYQGMDEETGKMMFSLEANNLVDEDGNSKQTQVGAGLDLELLSNSLTCECPNPQLPGLAPPDCLILQ